MKCAHCDNTFNTVDLIKHLRKEHNGQYKCGVQTCTRIFTQGSKLATHLKSSHANEILAIPLVINSHHDTALDFIEPVFNTAKKNIPDAKFEPDEQVSKFLLDLQGKDNITRSQVSSIANSVVEFLFQPLLNSVSGSKETDLIDKVELMKCSLISLRDEYTLITSLSNQKCYIAPKPIAINRSVQIVQKKHTNQYGIRKKEGSYIPLTMLFKQFFELPNVLEYTLRHTDKLKGSESISNFIQGNLWKNKINLFGNKLVIPFHLYFDDWEPDNALGSHKRLNSIAATYVLFPTLPPHFQSKLENILVAQLFKTQDKIYGDNLILISIL